jgi:type III pantothenate kinase
MKLLLVDNSNTRTKFALSREPGNIELVARLPTADISPRTLREALAGLSFDAATLCSVVPLKAAVLEAGIAPRAPLHRLDHRSPLGIGIDYPNPAEIGADRLANAVGVVARHGHPAIVIDFGTAVTFDVITAAPAYAGGAIAPGLGAMADYLGRRTALLPTIELSEPGSAIARSTADAMRVGAVIGYRGLIREILAAIHRELPGPATVVATGGDAALIAAGLPEIRAVDPILTLAGIDLVGRRVFG